MLALRIFLHAGWTSAQVGFAERFRKFRQGTLLWSWLSSRWTAAVSPASGDPRPAGNGALCLPPTPFTLWVVPLLGTSTSPVDIQASSRYRSMEVLRKPIRKLVEAAVGTPISLHSLRRTWENLLCSGKSDAAPETTPGTRPEINRAFRQCTGGRRAWTGRLVKYPEG